MAWKRRGAGCANVSRHPLLDRRASVEVPLALRDEPTDYFFSGTQVVLARSYLKPGAPFRSSLVSSRDSHHLSFFLAVLTALNGTMTSFSPAPRNPPTPMTRPVILPDLSTRTSSMSPILLSFGSYTACL